MPHNFDQDELRDMRTDMLHKINQTNLSLYYEAAFWIQK